MSMSGMPPIDVLNISLDDYTNVTNITFSPYYQHSLFVAVIYILAYFFIFLLCMVGNTLVCCIVLENRRMRTVINLFIFNLAVSDLLVGIFCIPTTLVDNLITGASSVLPSDSTRRLRFELVVISAPWCKQVISKYDVDTTPFPKNRMYVLALENVWLIYCEIGSPSLI